MLLTTDQLCSKHTDTSMGLGHAAHTLIQSYSWLTMGLRDASMQVCQQVNEIPGSVLCWGGGLLEGLHVQAVCQAPRFAGNTPADRSTVDKLTYAFDQCNDASDFIAAATHGESRDGTESRPPFAQMGLLGIFPCFTPQPINLVS